LLLGEEVVPLFELLSQHGFVSDEFRLTFSTDQTAVLTTNGLILFSVLSLL